MADRIRTPVTKMEILVRDPVTFVLDTAVILLGSVHVQTFNSSLKELGVVEYETQSGEDSYTSC